MATVNKDFRVKHGLVVEGATGTISGKNIITAGISDAKGDLIVGSADDAVARLGVGTNGQVLTAASGATYGVQWSDPAAVGSFADSIVFEGSTANDYETTLAVTDPTADRTITLPNATGTVALTSDITTAVDAITTSVIEEGTNLYFTDERAQDAVGNAVGTGLTYNDTSGAISVTTNTYDAYGSASTVAGNLTTHTSATEAHGATGAVVGTTNTQTLTNKTLTSPKINEDVAVTATATELNLIDGSVAGTIVNSKAVVYGSAGEVNATTLQIAGTSLTATATELNYVDGVTSAIQTQLDGKLDESGGTMTGNIAMGTNKVTGLGTPTDATDAATKAYVDAVTQGLHIHPSAVTATTTNISISADLEVGDVIDGVTLADTNRVLVKNQSTASENGIYVVQPTGAAIRATDFDQPSEVDGGDFIFVTGGTANDNTGWVQTSTTVVTIGTDPIYFTQFSGAGTYTAGTGLDLNGTEFVLDLSEVSTTTLPEGSNLYYTDTRAKTDAAALLTGATLTNITITGNGAGLTITAENGVADSNTDNLTEGTTNKYFTNQRAVDALQAVVPDFTAIEVNNIAKQVAATVSAPTAASPVVAYAFAKATYRSAKFLVKVAYSTHTEISEVLLTLDSSDNIAITEFAVVSTNVSASSISAGISGSNVQLLVTPVNDTSTVTIVGTLLA
jgi:hypothetical protein